MAATKIITINQLIEMFKSFSTSHKFINDFGYGPTSDIGTSRQMRFPYLWATHTVSSSIEIINKTYIPNLNFTFIFVDQINIQKNYKDVNGLNSDNQQEIISDSFQLGQDLLIYIQNELAPLGVSFVDESVTADAIYDETQDKVTGWRFDINLKLKHINCIIPIDDIIIAPTECPDVKVYMNGVLFETVVAGSSLNVIVKDTNGLSVGSKIGSEWIVPAAPSDTPTGKLMKTNNTVSYRTGDDGDLEKGRATDFFTLSDNNPFGNTNKLTDELGTQIYANNIVLDWSTYDGSEVLGYDRRVNAGNANVNVSHDQAVDASLAHSNSGFTSGWRLTNRNEFNNIINDGASIWVNYSPFNLNATNFGYIVSTVRTNGVSYFYFPNSGTIVPLARSFVGGGVRYIACRDFTNVELGI